MAGEATKRIGDAALKEKTGKEWAEWFRILDKAGAKKMKHGEIAQILAGRGVPAWWCQMVTVGYEQERGLREVHQKMGGYSVSASKTVNVPIHDLYAAWTDAKRRAKWLKSKLTVRKSTENKSMRITWTDGEQNVDVGFYPKGDAKSMVSLEHSKLQSKDEVAEKKALWSEALGRLKEQLES